MGYALPVSVQMTDMECGECGIQFSVPETWRAHRQRTGNSWYCPNGHSRVYRESDDEKARKNLAAEKQRHAQTLARLNDAEAAERKAQSEMKRMKKRAAAGVCPCCNRTFQSLQRHMISKHPEYIKKSKNAS